MSSTSGERAGRHHAGTWRPQVRPATHSPPPAHARVEPEIVLEQPVPGLHRFDLGTIPASVTPPPTWRMAALFAVASSLAVVGGLVFAATALVGKPKNTETIDALPNYPSLPIFQESTAEPAAVVPPKAPSSRVPARSGLIASPSPQPVGAERAATTPSLTDAPGTAPAEPSGAPLVRRTTPMRAFATNDAQEIGDRTETFYRQVTADVAAAFAMTTGDLREQGEQAFRQRYDGIRSIQVRQIEIDPNQGTTVSEVRITRADGSASVERRRLKFSSGTNPRISSEVTH